MHFYICKRFHYTLLLFALPLFQSASAAPGSNLKVRLLQLNLEKANCHCDGSPVFDIFADNNYDIHSTLSTVFGSDGESIDVIGHQINRLMGTRVSNHDLIELRREIEAAPTYIVVWNRVPILALATSVSPVSPEWFDIASTVSPHCSDEPLVICQTAQSTFDSKFALKKAELLIIISGMEECRVASAGDGSESGIICTMMFIETAEARIKRHVAGVCIATNIF